MQRLRKIARSLGALRYGQDTDPRMQRLLGVAGVAALVCVLAASVIVYVVPFGKTTYSALLSEAGSVHSGDDVRIAGISVGTVKGLDLLDESVRMTFTVESNVFIGDSTALDIRMLTVVGGHYVAVFPAGKTGLGSHDIPESRVHLPYSLINAMQDAQRPLSGVDGNTLRDSLANLTASLQRSPGSVKTTADGLTTLVGMLDKQKDDVGRALDVAEEYVKVLSNSRSVIGGMLSKIGQMEDQILDRRGEVMASLQVLSELLARIAAIEPSYRESLEPLVDKLIELAPPLRELGGKLGGVAQDLAAAGERLRAVIAPDGITVDQSGVALPAMCVPVPGRSC
ncbi:MlaD family protein [Rhodococcus sp. G-MC3]|uniref:MlaD family protein n=1 Tax=Rhodococcus sp. G-MC3 TaxID=3046209 RepID=UPI0024B953CB|nr:MlaD family protein [Rhodococcus sp. G-MC3]MDJ0392671.1 MlaD family protein [Rhodococcus sp. G-MC3]